MPDVASLTPDECWELLRRQEFGRLAYALDGQVNIVPINYAVDDGRLVFRTAQGSKLSAVLQGGIVAFEVDDIQSESASSVIVRGPAQELGEEEARWADQLRLRPWVPTEKHHVVAIRPSEISGMSFHLHRPWRWMSLRH